MSVKISLEVCKILAPNCGGGDTITATFTATDASGHMGTAILIGSKNSINAISDTNYLELRGIDGVSIINTVMGNVNVSQAYQTGFNIKENITVSLHVVDCKGWHNIEDPIGHTNAVMTHENNYLQDQDGSYIAFIK